MPRRRTVTTLLTIVSLAVLGGVGVVPSAAHTRTVTKSGYCLVTGSNNLDHWVKSNYCLTVRITGIPSKITLNQSYTYTVKVKNTGRLAFKKGVLMKYYDANFVTGSSPKSNKKYPAPGSGEASGIGWTNIGSIKAGATKTVKVYVTYNDPSKVHRGNYAGVEVYVKGIGTSAIKDVVKTANY